MKKHKNNQKKILFKAQSPFPIFTACLIGQLYYSDDYKILIVNGDLYKGFNVKAVELGFFDEIIFINESDKTRDTINKIVGGLLKKHNDIDEYFMCIFSDCYSLAIAYALKDTAILHLFPEGSTTVHIDKTIELLCQKGDFIKNNNTRAFFEDYPMDLSLFDYTWMYDMDVPQGDIRAQKRSINATSILCEENDNSTLNRLNALFKYDYNTDYNICMMDTFTPETNYLDYETERVIIEELFEGVHKSNIIVKPHPPNSSIPFVKYKYRNTNIEVLNNADVPWELIFLNLIKNDCKELTIVSLQLEGTYVMTTIAMMPAEFKLNLVVLSEVEKEHMNQYLKCSYDMVYDYFSELIRRVGVNVYIPNSIEDIKRIRTIILGDCNNSKARPSISSSNYFRKTGNLITKSFMYDTDCNFWSTAFFSFIPDKIEALFEVNKIVKFEELIWIPSEKNIFSSVRSISVIISDNQGIVKRFDLPEAEDTIIDRGRLLLRVAYSGYCSVIRIIAELAISKTFVKLYSYYFDKSWRCDFWENWCEIINGDVISRKKELRTGELWLFGKAKIAKEISRELDKYSIKHRFVVSSNRKETNDENVMSVDEAYGRFDAPLMIVVTAMNEYEQIVFGLPPELRRVVVGLSDFTDWLIRG